MGEFRGRTDFDVRVIWTLLNFGAGNLARQRERRAEVGQAVAAQSRTINEARRQVASAQAEILATRGRIAANQAALARAEEGFRLDLQRTELGEGKPIEVLNNLNRLAEARVRLVQAIVIYNQAQLRLFVALGTPPPPASLPGRPRLPLHPSSNPCPPHHRSR